MTDNIEAKINSELAEMACLKQEPINIRMFSGRYANNVIVEAMKLPDPKPLFDCFWYEGEISCLFADTNLGKSILAVQIANDIAKSGEKVLYFDFELSDKQFQRRYTDEHNHAFTFSDNLMRVVINREQMTVNLDNEYLSGIEEFIVATGSRVVVVDNLTWLCAAAEKGVEAATLMQRLMALKFKYGLSMLVVAHTPKRERWQPLTDNNLAGSKQLGNFFDSLFAIGKSTRDERLRYIKQVKVREGAHIYTGDNVRTCYISKDKAFTHFVFEECASEKELLKPLSDFDESNLLERMMQLHNEGKSYRSIADELGVTYYKVQSLLSRD